MTILIASELGSGYGHATQVGAVAEALTTLGVEPIVIAKDVTTMRAVLGYDSVREVLQAPFRFKPLPRFARVNSFADILIEAGFADTDGLAARIRSWITLFERCGAELLILDHAPTALFAAQAVGLRCAAITSTFSIPPATAPFPQMLSQPVIPDALRRKREQVLLEILASALRRLGLQPPESLQTPYRSLKTAFGTYAELDHYGQREDARYLGCGSHARGAEVIWPEGSGTRLFLYAPWHPAIDASLKALLAAGYQISAVIPDAPTNAVAGAPNLSLSRSLVDLDSALQSCELFVNHASLHSVTLSLMRETPCVMIPLWQEQGLFAERVAALGAGRMARPETVVATVQQMLEQREHYRAAARVFSQRYASFDHRAAHRDFLRELLARALPATPAAH